MTIAHVVYSTRVCRVAWSKPCFVDSVTWRSQAAINLWFWFDLVSNVHFVPHLLLYNLKTLIPRVLFSAFTRCWM